MTRIKLPSLFNYFAIVGAVLLGLFMLANSVLEPDGPEPRVVKATPKVIVKHDPRASLVERLRAEEAAQAAAAKGETPAPSATVGVSLATRRTEPLTPPAAPASAEPVQLSAPTAVPTATPADDAAARAARLARKKNKAERIRKQRLARERARALEEAAARPPYYGSPPHTTYGPFGAWGRVQRW
jgi:hypothetical protein